MNHRNKKLWINFPFLVLLFSQTVFVQISEGKNNLIGSSDNSQKSNKYITDNSQDSDKIQRTDDTTVDSNVLKFLKLADSGLQKILKLYYDNPDDYYNMKKLISAINDYLKNQGLTMITLDDTSRLRTLLDNNKESIITDKLGNIEILNTNNSDKFHQNVSGIKEDATKIKKNDDNRILLDLLAFLRSKDSKEIMGEYYSNLSNTEIKTKTLNYANKYISEKGVSKDKFDDPNRFFSLLDVNEESGISKVRAEIADLESSNPDNSHHPNEITNPDNSHHPNEITNPDNSLLYRRSKNPIYTRIWLDLLNFLKSNNKIMNEYYSNLSNSGIKTKTLNAVNEYMSEKGVSWSVFADPDRFFPILGINAESGIANVKAEISYLGSRDPDSMKLYSTVLEFLNSNDSNIQKTIEEYYQNPNAKTNADNDANIYMEKIIEALNAYFDKKDLQSIRWNSAVYYLKSLLDSSKELGIKNVKDTISYIQNPNTKDTKLYSTVLGFLRSGDSNIQKTINDYYQNLNAKTNANNDANIYMEKIIEALNAYFDKKGLQSIRWNSAVYYLQSLLDSSRKLGIKNLKDKISYIKNPNPEDTELYSTVLGFLRSEDSNIQKTINDYYQNLNAKTNANIYMEKIIEALNAYFDKKGLQSIRWNSAVYYLKSLLGPIKESGIENVSYMSRNYDAIRLDRKVLKFLKSKDPYIKTQIDKYYKKPDDSNNMKELLDAFNASQESEGLSKITSDDNSRWKTLLGTNKGLSILNIKSKIDYIKSKNPKDTRLYSNVLKFLRSEDSNIQKILKDYYNKPDDNINNLKKAINYYLKETCFSDIQFVDNSELRKLVGHNKGLGISNIQDEIFYANEGMKYDQKKNLQDYGRILSFVDSKKDSDLKDYYKLIQSVNHDEVEKTKSLKKAESDVFESFKKFLSDKYQDIYYIGNLNNIISLLGYNSDMAYKKISERILYTYEDMTKPDIEQISFDGSIHDFLTSDNPEYAKVINNYYLDKEKGNSQALKKLVSYFKNKVGRYSSLDITGDYSYWQKLLGNDLKTAKDQADKNLEKSIYGARINKLYLEQTAELEKEEREQRPFKIMNALLYLFSIISPNNNKFTPLNFKWPTNTNKSRPLIDRSPGHNICKRSSGGLCSSAKSRNPGESIRDQRSLLLRVVLAPLGLADKVRTQYSKLTNWIRKKTPRNHPKPTVERKYSYGDTPDREKVPVWFKIATSPVSVASKARDQLDNLKFKIQRNHNPSRSQTRSENTVSSRNLNRVTNRESVVNGNRDLNRLQVSSGLSSSIATTSNKRAKNNIYTTH